MKSLEFEILKKSLAWFSEDQKKLLQKKLEFEFFDMIIGIEIFDGITGRVVLLSKVDISNSNNFINFVTKVRGYSVTKMCFQSVYILSKIL